MSTNNATRMIDIQSALKAALDTDEVNVTDDSHLHAGHAGARDGAGHFTVLVVSERFKGVNAVGRHRLVYAALNEMMGPEIHALAITALSPDEI